MTAYFKDKHSGELLNTTKAINITTEVIGGEKTWVVEYWVLYEDRKKENKLLKKYYIESQYELLRVGIA